MKSHSSSQPHTPDGCTWESWPACGAFITPHSPMWRRSRQSSAWSPLCSPSVSLFLFLAMGIWQPLSCRLCSSLKESFQVQSGAVSCRRCQETVTFSSVAKWVLVSQLGHEIYLFQLSSKPDQNKTLF